MKHKLLPTVLMSLLCGSVLRPQSTHTITFTFDYDFRITPACSPTVKEKCVQQFNFYDISAGIPKSVKLGSFAVPPGSTGLIKGMSVTTKSLLFNPGRHMFAVSAQMPNGRESDLGECATKVKIR